MKIWNYKSNEDDKLVKQVIHNLRTIFKEANGDLTRMPKLIDIHMPGILCCVSINCKL